VRPRHFTELQLKSKDHQVDIPHIVKRNVAQCLIIGVTVALVFLAVCTIFFGSVD
jgi:hypothetical protein